MTNPIAVSTAWNHTEDKKGDRILSEIKELGTDVIELGYRVTRDQLAEIESALPEIKMSVSSVHNFCPVPDDHPSPRHPSNYYRLSSIDEEERKRAVHWARMCVNTAVRTGAKIVVVHAGMIEMENDPSIDLLRLCKKGEYDLTQFKTALDKVLVARKQARDPFLDAVRQSMEEVMPYAKDRDIRVGLETRYYPTEIPNFEEIGELLDLFRDQGMGYWHDVGHAEVQERLGIVTHEKFLKTYEKDLIGFHIHGVQDIKDHHAPFTGDFELEKVIPFMKDYHCLVVESHGAAQAEDLKAALHRLQSENLSK